MLLTSLIFASVFAIFFFLFVLFYFKDSDILQIIFLSLAMCCLPGIYCPIMLYLMPDSLHLLSYSLVALVFACIAKFFYMFNRNFVCKLFKHTFYLLSELFWFLTFSSIFFVSHVSNAVFIIAALIYFILFLVLCIFSGSHKLIFYVFIFIHCSFSSILNFTALCSLFYSLTLDSILFFAGTFISGSMLFIYAFSKLKRRISNHSLIETVLLIISQVCFCSSCILMQIL